MSGMQKDPVQPADDAARSLARDLIASARIAALGVIDPESGFPMVSRIALGPGPGDGIFSLVSGLSAHSRALRADPRVSLLLGEAGAKGDPLSHPRLTLLARAEPVPASEALRDQWLADHPKAKLYLDLPDFFFLRFQPVAAALNGGFGRAYRLSPEDLR